MIPLLRRRFCRVIKLRLVQRRSGLGLKQYAHIYEDVRRCLLHRTAIAGLLELDNLGLMTPRGSASVHDMQNVIWTCCPPDSRLHDGGPGDRRPPYRRPSNGKRPLLPSSHSHVFLPYFVTTLRAQFVPSSSRGAATAPNSHRRPWQLSTWSAVCSITCIIVAFCLKTKTVKEV